MTAMLLLLAAALCIAPWRAPAAERLLDLTPAPATGRDSGTSGSGAFSSGAFGSPRRGAPRSSDPLARLLAPVIARAPGRRSRAGDTGSLARMLDLLAVALLAGLPTHLALAAVADAVSPTDPDAAAPLRAASARVHLGATPAEAWRDVPGAGRLTPVAAVLARATDGGGSVRSALDHAAGRMRSEADAAATARAERAAVLVAGPLGLCFLPAFICLGVLPVVVGLADGMLPGALP